ncbi:type I restriction enzyme, S subunit [Succinivibrio dextrinosolvens DSM 3072]|uniref:Type I restriction enzyme, S subunit n=1 Tax=Succinivibrio dextrinosolvens DSM 3072 TaxID=1123324 RepID=A0A1T4UZ35_9GAMM|nr:restriction endonuclease subunit S [Succinivibrio dextrinosolvens]SKA57999.1 type I restriction enzyme, S subunit [Succinivibrio dextrinosolvens DSM 3072]
MMKNSKVPLAKDSSKKLIQLKKIKEICEIVTDYTAAGSFADIAKNVKYISDETKGFAQLIRTTDIKNNFSKSNKFIYVDKHAYDYLWRVNLNKEGLILPNVGNCGEIYYVSPGIFPSKYNVLGPNSIFVRSETVDNRFLFHLFQTNKFQKQLSKITTKTGHSKFNKTNFKELVIPLPCIDVQHELVGKLDKFEKITKDLISELTEELNARRKQYLYYLNRYFDEQTDNLVKLDDIGNLKRGKRFVHADAVECGVPCIHYGELYTYYGIHAKAVKSHIREDLRNNMRYAHKGDVIIVGAGENNQDIGVGVSWEGNEDVAVHDACYTLTHNQNSRYISYYLRTHMYHEQIKRYISSGKICSISAEGIGKSLIPIPSLKKQDEIVSVLDKLEVLSKSLLERISEEINARRMQFEYYRNRVLDF